MAVMEPSPFASALWLIDDTTPALRWSTSAASIAVTLPSLLASPTGTASVGLGSRPPWSDLRVVAVGVGEIGVAVGIAVSVSEMAQEPLTSGVVGGWPGAW